MSTINTVNAAIPAATMNTVDVINAVNAINSAHSSTNAKNLHTVMPGMQQSPLTVMSTQHTSAGLAGMSTVGSLTTFNNLHAAAPPGSAMAGGAENMGVFSSESTVARASESVSVISTEIAEDQQASVWPSTMTNVATHLYRSFGYATSHDRADALHNAILRLLSLQTKSGIHLHEEELRKWLHCVASRMLLDARRMQLRTTVFSDLGSSETSPEFELDLDEDFFEELPTQHGLDISYALQRLSPSLRACFELHSQGFSAEEVACTLGLGRDAVHKRIQRARREMQLNLKEYL